MAESASRLVSQSTRSTPAWASTTSRPPPLAESTAARSARATARSSSIRCSAMPPGSSVAPGSWRATLRSWVSRRVASAYGCGAGVAAACMSRCIAPAATRAERRRGSATAAQTARYPSSPSSGSPSAVGEQPPTTSVTAATPSSAAHSREPALQGGDGQRHGEVRQQRRGAQPRPTVSAASAAAATWLAPSPTMITSASRPSGPRHRSPGRDHGRQRRRAPAGAIHAQLGEVAGGDQHQHGDQREHARTRSRRRDRVRRGSLARAVGGRSSCVSAVDRVDLVGVLLRARRCA